MQLVQYLEENLQLKMHLLGGKFKINKLNIQNRKIGKKHNIKPPKGEINGTEKNLINEIKNFL